VSVSSTHRFLILGPVLLALAACGGGGGGSTRPVAAVTPPTPLLPAAHSQCSLAEARNDVLDLFENFYFFNTEPDQVAKYADIRSRLDTFTSVDALLDALRYQPGIYDRGFSYYATQEEVDQYFTAGEFYGFGFSVGVDGTGAWRLMDVFGGSPSDEAGLTRGDTIVAVDGVSTADLNLNSESTFGPSELGVTRTLRIRHLDASMEDVTLVKAVVGLDPVPPARVRVFDVGGRMVGYVFFRTFIEDADALLRQAMVSLKEQATALGGTGIDDLVLDLRYNGGGLVDTAEVLGSLITDRAGAEFFTYEYNEWVTSNYGSSDDIRYFHDEADALPGLENIYYLTDAGTASASELTISGVSPYMTRSVTIGAGTYGKPVGQWGLEYCNSSMVLFIVTFRTVNSLGAADYADYYGGIPADCAAPDDWDHPLGDPSEARLAAALDNIESNGSICTAPVMRAAAQSLDGAPVTSIPGPITGPSLAAKLINAY
jgi:carboxyl-terminal processing protease